MLADDSIDMIWEIENFCYETLQSEEAYSEHSYEAGNEALTIRIPPYTNSEPSDLENCNFVTSITQSVLSGEVSADCLTVSKSEITLLTPLTASPAILEITVTVERIGVNSELDISRVFTVMVDVTDDSNNSTTSEDE